MSTAIFDPAQVAVGSVLTHPGASRHHDGAERSVDRCRNPGWPAPGPVGCRRYALPTEGDKHRAIRAIPVDELSSTSAALY